MATNNVPADTTDKSAELSDEMSYDKSSDMSADNAEVVIEGTVFNERQVKLLKYVVIGLGVLLLLGLAIIISTIVYKASQMGDDENAGNPTITRSVSHANTKMSAIAITEGSKVIATSIDGARLAITVESKGGFSIFVIDVRSGKLLSRTELAPPP